MELHPASVTHGFARSLPAKLEKLVSPDANHVVHLSKREKEKILHLKGQLQQIGEILMEPSEVEFPASVAGCWVEEVRELSYDIDDFHDELVNKCQAFQNNRHGSKLLKRRGRWISSEISRFRIRLEKAIQRYKTYNLQESKKRQQSYIASEDDERASPPPLCGLEDARPVGIGDSLAKVESLLTDEGELKRRVVAVVGLGGVGKTTLANELYRDLRKQFDCHAFERSSQMPDMRKLLTSILLQVRPHRPPDVSESCNLTNTIKTHLQKNKYFIVIDDLWSLSTWDHILQALPDNNRSSWILTTTEVDAVAHRCCGNDSSYMLRMEPLSKDRPQELLFRRFDGKGPEFSEPSPEISSESTDFIKEIKSEILRKCGGFPLAIVSISSLLASQPQGNIEKWYYVWSSLSYNLKTNPTAEGMKQVLSLCYNSLPDQLKTCMLYFSIYKQGHIIWKDDLVKLWIAEGFICAKGGKDKEEIASIYFDELVTKGMIEPVDNSHNGQVISCTLHYMILELIQCKSIEENFVVTIHHSETNIRLGGKIRRLSLHFGDAEDAKPPDKLELSQVRTLAFCGLYRCMPSLAEFQLLRVVILDLWSDHDNIKFELPTFCMLGYLEIACNVKLVLQIQLQGLQYLHTLKIDSRSSEVPQDIVDLPRLLHLSLPGDTNLPNCIGHMSSLRTFGCFNLSSNSANNVRSLDMLKDLHDLHLTCSTMLCHNLEENFGILSSVLQKLSNLKSLTLLPAENSSSANFGIPCDRLLTVSPPPALLEKLELSLRICIFSRIPGWIGNLGNLSILKIAVWELSQSEIDVLNSLAALSALLLYVRIAPSKRIVLKEGFQVLKHFKFVCSTFCLAFEEGAMPSLRSLKLGFNTNRLHHDSLAEAGLENLKRLSDFSAKIGCAGAREHGKLTKSALEDTLRSGERQPIINIHLVPRDFDCEEGMSMVGKTDEAQIPEKADVIITGCGGPTETYETGDKDSSPAVEISRDTIRITLSSDPSSTTGNQGQDETTRSQEEKYQKTEEQGLIVEGDSHEQPATENGSGEDKSEQADSRASVAPEHSLDMQTKPFSYMQSQEQDKNRVTQQELHDATKEQKSDGRVSVLPEEFDLEGHFSQIEGSGDLNQTSELLTPQIHSDHRQTQECHLSHITTKSPEKQSGVLENSPDEDKTKQHDRRSSAVTGSSSYWPKSEIHSSLDGESNKEIQPDVDHGRSQQYDIRKDNSKVVYPSQVMEPNVVREPGDTRYNMIVESSYSSLYPGGTKWRPMDTAHGIKYLISQYMKQERLRAKNDIPSIKLEMELMTIIIAENKENGPGSVPEKWVMQLQDLVHDIEDFVDVYNWLHIRSWRRTLAHMSHIVNLKNRVKIIREWQQNAIQSKNDASSAAPSGASAVSSPDYVPQGAFVGMNSLRDELLQLVCNGDYYDFGPSKPTVICIVGPRGVGKTALARAVCYDDDRVQNEFEKIVWVVASTCSSGYDLVCKINKQVDREASGTSPDTYKYKLKYTPSRCLVVIDELQQAGMMQYIRRALSAAEMRSPIIVTTSIQSVAAACSPEGYIMRMQGLDRWDSEELFMRTLGVQLRTPAQQAALQTILSKYGGLPVAMISVANYLHGQGQKNLTERMAKIGSYFAGAPGSFEGMGTAFTKDYNSLPDSVHRTCLLYLSTFPEGHLINRKSLIRRWIAEGLIVGDGVVSAEQVADDCFDNWIDRNIIEPVRIGFNSTVKSCRVNDFLLECVVSKSVCKNFVALIRGDEPFRSGACPVRRLSVHGGTTKSRKVAMEMGLNRVRSLTISRGVPMDFRACRLLRVLDMEGCNQIGDRVLNAICCLVLLKYLGLRDTNVCRIPSAIRNLSGLETLDMRKTRVDLNDSETTVVDLPIDVFMLPRLSHLFGRFQLPQQFKNKKKARTMLRFFSEESRLHTLSGFVTLGSNGFEHIVLHIRRLRKVKIWCQRDIGGGPDCNISRDSLRFFMSSLERRFTGNNALESVSMDFGGSSMGAFFAGYFSNRQTSGPCMLSSIKLRGKIVLTLPRFITSPANNLSELQLSCTGLPLEELSTLQSLRRLLYLKLAEDGDGFAGDTFVVETDGFPSLEKLCFEAPKLPRLHILKGAMPALTSLHLLCPQSQHYSSYGKRIYEQETTSEIQHSNQELEIEYLENLNDLVLHSSVDDKELEFWKEKARRHINRPRVTRQSMP